MASIKCGHCTKTHTSVEMVRTCWYGEQADKNTPATIATQLVQSGPDFTVKQDGAIVAHKPQPVTEPGMYQKPNGVVYRVKISKKNGFPYAEKMVPGKFGKVTFEYVAYEIKTLTADMRMTVESASKIGAKYGACCVCGRTLTDTTKNMSVQKGIGPVCATKI